MRKLTVALIALLVCAMALPVVAAPKVEVTGSLKTEIKLSPKDPKVEGESDLRLNLGMGIGAGDAIKAVVEFAPIKWAPFDRTGVLPDPMPEDDKVEPGKLGSLTPVTITGPNGLTIDKAYLESTGAYWPGGPQVVTRLGDLAIDYSPYIAFKDETDGKIEGASMSGLPVGPMTLSAFYGWDGQTWKDQQETRIVRGASASALIQGIDLAGSVVKAGDDLYYVGQAGFSPMPNLSVSGLYAADEPNSAAARKVEATITNIPILSGMTVKAGYRDFDWAFDPVYRDRSKDDDDEPDNVVDNNKGERGFDAEVSTTVQGINLRGFIDQHEQRKDGNAVVGTRRIIGVGADTEVEGFKLSGEYKLTTSTVPQEDPEVTTVNASAERTFPVGALAVNAKYGLKFETNKPTTHDVQASTVLPVPVLNAVELNGKARLEGDDLTYVAGAGYTAPNGIKFAVNYSNGYEDRDAEITYPDGLSASAGLTVEF
ncbi:MAG TPA: hypothetical protein GX506_01300 [Firmicutes bacterium]|nr:hypothetical protein [Bacillota bacterium]